MNKVCFSFYIRQQSYYKKIDIFTYVLSKDQYKTTRKSARNRNNSGIPCIRIQYLVQYDCLEHAVRNES